MVFPIQAKLDSEVVFPSVFRVLTGSARQGREPWGPFLESPGNFSGPKSNIQIET